VRHFIGWLALLGAALAGQGARAAKVPVLVDTDAGSDDLMALAYLLTQPEVELEAVTVVSGLAHVDRGARNVLRLLALAGRNDVPVFEGETKPIEGDAAFPDEWRANSDELRGVDLPEAGRAAAPTGAVDFLAARFAEPRKRRLLALGPLTNVARALERRPAAAGALESITIMGGALSVPGNLGDGGYFRTENKTAEWNMFVDPAAAQIVFTSGLPLVLVPLDATNRVPIDARFVRSFTRKAASPLARFVAQLLANEEELIRKSMYFAWDPLAAVVLLHPEAVRLRDGHIEILRKPPTDGRTWLIPGTPPNARVAADADAKLFAKLFGGAFDAAAH
jgi:inosine-uridine nucleoside N-ribohydrolase